jgi:hypothetical protein
MSLDDFILSYYDLNFTPSNQRALSGTFPKERAKKALKD